jgi:hypothetical protein
MIPDEILISREELNILRNLLNNIKDDSAVGFSAWVKVMTITNTWMARPSAYVKPSQLEFPELVNRVNKLENAINRTIPEELNNLMRYTNSLHDSIIKLIKEEYGRG